MKENEVICLLFGHILFMALIFYSAFVRAAGVDLCLSSSICCLYEGLTVHRFIPTSISWEMKMNRNEKDNQYRLGHLTGVSWKWDSRHFHKCFRSQQVHGCLWCHLFSIHHKPMCGHGAAPGTKRKVRIMVWLHHRKEMLHLWDWIDMNDIKKSKNCSLFIHQARPHWDCL